METLLYFALVILFITVLTARYQITPFFTLVCAAVIYGFLAGLSGEMIPLITGGMGKIFSLLGIPIFSGAVIAQVLRQNGYLEQIVSDLRAVVNRPAPATGIAGYLLSIPMMCCITPFVVLSPLVAHLDEDRRTTTLLLSITAFGTVISFVLLYPLPVVYSVVTTLGLQDFPVAGYTAVAVPLSLFLLATGILLLGRGGRGRAAGEDRSMPAQEKPGWKAWAPVLVPILLIALGALVTPLRLVGNVNIALLAGATTGLVMVSPAGRIGVLEKGTKNAGIILFDLCGAGALGSVIAASAFADEMTALLFATVPVILIPFILAVLMQTAQGSRVVTAVITATILAKTTVAETIAPVPLVLMIAAGTLLFSYVSDPYFWLIKRSTGEGLGAVMKLYTLPLAAAGLLIFAAAIVLAALNP
jgi:GntP family gluconate:H+ symporter